MDVFAIVNYREKPVAENESERISRKLESFLPFGQLQIQREIWRSPQARTVLWTWRPTQTKKYNSKTAQPFIHNDGARAFAVSGYWYSSDCSSLESLHQRMRHASDRDKVVTKLGGEHIPIYCDGESAELWRGLSTIPPLFYACGADFVVVSNRASIAYAILNGGSRPQYDSQALATFAAGQVYATNSTVFSGVKVVGVNDKLTLSGGAIKATKIDEAHMTYCAGDSLLDEACLDDLCDSLISSARTVNGTTENLRIQLSGGKDSRLIASSIAAAGIEPTARIFGWQNDEDTLIARDIAKHLKWNIEDATADSEAQSIVDVDWKKGLAESLFLMDGLRYFKPSSLIHTPFSKTRLNFSPGISILGSAAEILRGGSAVLVRQWDWRRLKSLSQAEVENKMRGQLPLSNPLFRPEFKQPYKKWIDSWIEDHRTNGTPLELLEKKYLFFAYLYNWNVACWMSGPEGGEIHPALDNRVIRSVSKLSREFRLYEHVHKELVKRMCPKLLEFPFPNGEGWASDITEKKALSDNAKVNQPIYTLAGVYFRKEFTSALLDLPSHHRIFDIVKRDTLSNLLKDEALFQPPQATLIWNVLALQTLVDNEWITYDELKTKTVKVDIKTPWSDFLFELCQDINRHGNKIPLSQTYLALPRKEVQKCLEELDEVKGDPIKIEKSTVENIDAASQQPHDSIRPNFHISVSPSRAASVEKPENDFLFTISEIQKKGVWAVYSMPSADLASSEIIFSLKASTDAPYTGVSYIYLDEELNRSTLLARSSCHVKTQALPISISANIPHHPTGRLRVMIPLGQSLSKTSFTEPQLTKLLFNNQQLYSRYAPEIVTAAVGFRFFTSALAASLTDRINSLATLHTIDLDKARLSSTPDPCVDEKQFSLLARPDAKKLEKVVFSGMDHDDFEQITAQRSVIQAVKTGILNHNPLA